MYLETFDCKDRPELLAVVRVADPKYRKKRLFFSVSPSVEMNDTYWDGGSRSTYTAVRLDTLHAVQAPQYNPPQFGGPRDLGVQIPDGVAIVRTGFFCGKPAIASVTVNANTVAKLLPQPESESK